MPRISIFMSSYNYAKYLALAIESVLNQSFTDFELFIIDDASTDESWQIIQNYKDPRIKAYQNHTNLNSKHWMNKIVFEMASGEYFAVQHSDNIWEHDKLQKQIDFLDSNPDYAAVFTNAYIIDEKGRPLTDKTHFFYSIFDQPNRNRFEWLNHFFYHGNALCHPSILIRKACYDKCGGYRIGLAQIPDFDMWIRVCMAYEIHVMSEKLIQYRVQSNENFTSGNLPRNRIRGQFEFLQALNHYKFIASLDEFNKIFPEAKKYISDDNPDYLYALGKLATDSGQFMVHKLFGLNLLFEALNDPQRAKNLEIYQKFNHKKFFEMSAQHDIFSVEVYETLKKLDAYYSNSKSWRLTKPLRLIMKFIRGKKANTCQK